MLLVTSVILAPVANIKPERFRLFKYLQVKYELTEISGKCFNISILSLRIVVHKINNFIPLYFNAVK